MKTRTNDSRQRYKRCSEEDKDSLAEELREMQKAGHMRYASGAKHDERPGDSKGKAKGRGTK